MGKKGKIILLAVFVAVILGGTGFLVYQMTHLSGNAYTGESSEQAVSGTSSDKSVDNATVSGPDDTLEQNTGYILIGDSRFVGMDGVCDITETTGNREYVVAKVGQGLKWFKETGLSEAEGIEAAEPSIGHWKYVICLGINDLWDIDDYLEEYRSLRYTHDLIIVSVGPVGPSAQMENSEVDEFNTKLSSFCSLNGIRYIDYNTTLQEEGFTTQDGLHYTDDVYRRIYSMIETGMREP